MCVLLKLVLLAWWLEDFTGKLKLNLTRLHHLDFRRALCKACNINEFFDTFFLPQITQNTDRQPLATISSQLVNIENRQNGDQPVANEEVRKIVTFPHAIFANLDKINIEAEQNRLLQIQIEKPCIYEDESLKSPAPRKLYTPTKIERKRYRRQKSDPDFKCARRNANDKECEEPTNTICLRSKRKLRLIQVDNA